MTTREDKEMLKDLCKYMKAEVIDLKRDHLRLEGIAHKERNASKRIEISQVGINISTSAARVDFWRRQIENIIGTKK